MRAFNASFIAFVVLGFLVSPSPVWAFLFYAGLGPLILFRVYQTRQAAFWRDPLFLLLSATIVWFAATLLWGHDQSTALVRKYATALVVNGVFLAGGILFFHSGNREWRDRALAVLPMAGAVNAVIALGRHFLLHGEGVSIRLVGWAETRHEILGAGIMAVVALVTLRNLFIARERLPGGKAVQVLCLILCVVFIVLSGSRGPLAALVVSGGVFIILTRARLIMLPILAVVVAAIGLYLNHPSFFAALLENFQRPSMRGEIWAATLEHAAQRPLFGHGVANIGSFGPEWVTFPHSMYLSALYYGGAIGLVLVLAAFGFALWRTLRVEDRLERAFLQGLLLVPLVVGGTDTGQFIKPPSPQWYIVWLPLIIATAATLRTGRETSPR